MTPAPHLNKKTLSKSNVQSLPPIDAPTSRQRSSTLPPDWDSDQLRQQMTEAGLAWSRGHRGQTQSQQKNRQGTASSTEYSGAPVSTPSWPEQFAVGMQENAFVLVPAHIAVQMLQHYNTMIPKIPQRVGGLSRETSQLSEADIPGSAISSPSPRIPNHKNVPSRHEASSAYKTTSQLQAMSISEDEAAATVHVKHRVRKVKRKPVILQPEEPPQEDPSIARLERRQRAASLRSQYTFKTHAPYVPNPDIPFYHESPEPKGLSTHERYTMTKKDHPEIEYSPHTQAEYNELRLRDSTVRLGGLGPDLGREDRALALRKLERQYEYAAKLRSQNGFGV